MTSSTDDTLEDESNVRQEINAKDKSTIQHVIQTAIDKPAGSVHIGPTYTHSKQEELNNYLARAVAVYKGRMFQAVAQLQHPSSPYKLLSSFRIEDASIFYGRTSATKDLCKKVFQSRLLILHAKSGAGKTSLLNAGLFPHVIRQGCLPLYIHTYDKDPAWIIKQTLIPATLGLYPDELHNLSLHEFLAHVCGSLKHENIEELIIVLDQFEDFFLYSTQPSERLPFIKALGDCYSDQTLPIRIIIALRKDFYSDLIEFEEVLPHLHIFQHHYRPRPMTQQEVKEAIVQPLKELDSAVTYDPALLDILIAELNRNEIELPLLQIACTRLYETLGDKKKRITMKMYENLGRTEGVLRGYLNEVLAGLPEPEQVLAKSVLKEFVRSDLTKKTLNYDSIIARIEADKNKLDHILTQLVNARLLCRDIIEEETKYELVHEYLATEIVKWMDVEDREFKRAEELLRSELANWHSYGHLISLERLELLYPYRERFKGLDPKDWECLLRSAMEAEISIGDDYIWADVTNWVKVVCDIDATLLFKAIVEPLIAELQNYEEYHMRSNAAHGLAMIGEYAGIYAVEPLIAALQDNWVLVRSYAAKSLGKLNDIHAVEPLIAALQDEERIVCSSAAEALGKLGDTHAVEPLIAAFGKGNVRAAEALGKIKDARAFEPLITALKNQDSDLRRWAAWGLGKLGDVRAVEPLIDALKDNDITVRKAPAKALGEIGDVRATEPLIAILDDKDKEAREEAIEALGKIGDSRAVEPLIAVLQNNEIKLREKVSEALGKIGDTRAVEPLIAMLQDTNSNVRDCAAWALGNIGDSRAVNQLIISLRDKDSDVREYAAWALGEIADIRAIEPLIVALQDKDHNVRMWAKQSLDNIKKV